MREVAAFDVKRYVSMAPQLKQLLFMYLHEYIYCYYIELGKLFILFRFVCPLISL